MLAHFAAEAEPRGGNDRAGKKVERGARRPRLLTERRGYLRKGRFQQRCLQSAIANAENNHNLDVDELVVAEAWVGQAHHL